MLAAALLWTGACFAQPPSPPPPVVDEDVETAGDPLARARRLYSEALAAFAEGRADAARALVGDAFLSLSSAVNEPRMATALEPSLDAMLETLRSVERADPSEEPLELDVPPSEVEAATAAVRGEPGANGHAIPIDASDAVVQKYIALYTGKHRQHFLEALERSGRYRPAIEAELKREGLPPELFWLVMAESEFKLAARSRAGATGLWQFMPGTARRYGLEVSYWVDERYDPEKATRAALRYLRDLRHWFGDWHLAIASYNRGENGVGSALDRSRSFDFGDLAGHGMLPRETRHYVPKFMACVLIGEKPKDYGFEPEFEPADDYDTVRLDKSLAFEVAAKAAGVSEDGLRRLNPSYRAWAVPQRAGGMEFRVPKGKKDAFLEALAKVEDWAPAPKWIQYRVQAGDYLGRVARRHHTTVEQIVALNKIKDVRSLRVGQVLKIMPGRSYRARSGD